MRRTVLAVMLSVAIALALFVRHGHAEVPLAVNVSGLQMVAPGQVGGIVTITGWQPELLPTIEGTVRVGGRVIQGPPGPVVAARLPGSIDMAAGKFRIGGVAAIGDFTPVPPLEENTPITVELTVRQGNAVATARQAGVLLLPTVIVPGYLNDMSREPDPAIIATLEQRGYRATGASPDLFWFAYNSRALDLREAAQALASYVHDVVLPKTYAARINVVGYSLGGLMARWNIAFEYGWDSLVNRFVMVGVPNQGTVVSYVDAWYPAAAAWAQTPAARDMLPTFPFWRESSVAPWNFPPDVSNPSLDALNTQMFPEGIRVYAFYGNRQPQAHGPGTWAGVTGRLPNAEFSYGTGDGVVLTESALGLPIHGGAGVPAFGDRVIPVDLGPVGHLELLKAAISRIADVLTDRGASSDIGTSPEGRAAGPTAHRR